VAVGVSASGGPGSSIYVVKTGPDGTLEYAVAPDVARMNSAPSILASPNPFRSITAIPGYEKEPVVLFDIAGRIVGRYEGARIGGDLPPGVYFLKPRADGSAALRIVKVP
jgi:hypothetical protein